MSNAARVHAHVRPYTPTHWCTTAHHSITHQSPPARLSENIATRLTKARPCLDPPGTPWDPSPPPVLPFPLVQAAHELPEVLHDPSIPQNPAVPSNPVGLEGRVHLWQRERGKRRGQGGGTRISIKACGRALVTCALAIKHCSTDYACRDPHTHIQHRHRCTYMKETHHPTHFCHVWCAGK